MHLTRRSGEEGEDEADVRRMNDAALGSDLDKLHSLANEKLNTKARAELFEKCVETLKIENTEGSVFLYI